MVDGYRHRQDVGHDSANSRLVVEGMLTRLRTSLPWREDFSRTSSSAAYRADRTGQRGQPKVNRPYRSEAGRTHHHGSLSCQEAVGSPAL